MLEAVVHPHLFIAAVQTQQTDPLRSKNGPKLIYPTKTDTDSADPFQRYSHPILRLTLEFPSNDVDAVVGFLENKGFDNAAKSQDPHIIATG